MKRTREEELLEENEKLKKENENLKSKLIKEKNKKMYYKSVSLEENKCYACSTVDDAKYICVECEVNMCLDHCENCEICDYYPFCNDCVNEHKYCIYCRKKYGDKDTGEFGRCCFGCGISCIDDKGLFKGCSECKIAYDPENYCDEDDNEEGEENIKIHPKDHKNCKNGKLINLCADCCIWSYSL